MTPAELTATAVAAAEAIRSLNHHTRPAAAQVDVSVVYDLLAELALMTSRLPQLLRQLEDLLDQLVEAGAVAIIDGEHRGDPVAVAAITGHWLAAATGAATQLVHRVDQAQQTLTWAAPASR